jgi:hypothetical protein
MRHGNNTDDDIERVLEALRLTLDPIRSRRE